jgi:hypothetical protein
LLLLAQAAEAVGLEAAVVQVDFVQLLLLLAVEVL